MSYVNAPPEGRTTITVTTLAECPFSIADEYAKEYLQRAESGGEEAYVRVPLLSPLPALAHRVSVSFGIHTDINEYGRRNEEIHLRWSSGTRLLPDFRGTMTFRIETVRTRILIEGSYAIPGGQLGRWFDRAIGKHIARATLQDFSDRIASYLAERERNWRLSKT